MNASAFLVPLVQDRTTRARQALTDAYVRFMPVAHVPAHDAGWGKTFAEAANLVIRRTMDMLDIVTPDALLTILPAFADIEEDPEKRERAANEALRRLSTIANEQPSILSVEQMVEVVRSILLVLDHRFGVTLEDIAAA